MKEIKTENAIGHILCHDLTQIIKGVTKDARFRKGHVVTKEDIPVLLSMGKEHLFVFEQKEGYLHENDAAEYLIKLSKSENMYQGECKEGKIELFAECDGLFCYDAHLLSQINSIGEISIAARGNYWSVKKGDKLCGMRVIPLIIDEKKLHKAKEVCNGKPIFKILKYAPLNYSIVATGSELEKGIITDTFSPVVKEKMTQFGGKFMAISYPGDDKQKISNAITEAYTNGADLVVCTGGMSVDPDDRTPAAINAAGAKVVTYGAPVLPGAMFLYGTVNGKPIVGLPGCVMYAKRTVLDLVLPRIFAQIPLTVSDFQAMGAGGLCLSCETCTFPNCALGRG